MHEWQRIMDFEWNWETDCESQTLRDRIIIEIRPIQGCNDPFRAVARGRKLFECLMMSANELLPKLEYKDQVKN